MPQLHTPDDLYKLSSLTSRDPEREQSRNALQLLGAAVPRCPTVIAPTAAGRRPSAYPKRAAPSSQLVEFVCSPPNPFALRGGS